MALECDVLVIGSGLAGLSLALKAARHGRVIVVTKKGEAESNTQYAQGGIAAVFDGGDSFASHRRDTLRCGAGLCDEAVVRAVVEEGPERVSELASWGVPFSRAARGFALGREGFDGVEVGAQFERWRLGPGYARRAKGILAA